MATPPTLIDKYTPPPPQPPYAPAQAGRDMRGRRQQRQGADVNVGSTERLLSVAGGGALALFGLSRRSPLGLVLALAGGDLAWRGISGHCRVYEALGVSTAGKGAGTATRAAEGRGRRVERTVTINRPASELYTYWRNFENLPLFMDHLVSVTTTDPRQSHWVARAPFGRTIAWDAKITDDRLNELIAWRSLEGSDVYSAGEVRFVPAPDGRGTRVQVVMEYSPPGGAVGAIIARVFGEDPDRQVREDLRRFKQVMEAGEFPTTTGRPSGRGQE